MTIYISIYLFSNIGIFILNLRQLNKQEFGMMLTFTGGTEGCHKDNPGATSDGNVDIMATQSQFSLSTKVRHD